MWLSSGRLSEKVVGMTTDNARNIVAASAQLSWLRLPCVAHTLQLAVNAGLNISAVQRVSARCRKLVGHFRHSYVALNALESTQSRLGLPQHKLIQDITTRWNSSFEMMGRSLEQRAALSAVLLGSKRVSDRALMLTADELSDLEHITSVLQPLAQASTMLSSDQSLSLSLVQPLYSALFARKLSLPVKVIQKLSLT